ncbi:MULTISPECIES: PorP/SprF family type IX secretion system membrane protein [Flavobacterium]|uniref:PorP/SprF family type IX secretion system membrane protein n=1 Tax=Flavobacterium keumense TaxID=1306518 RepID=A0ABY8N4S5_9FLAO|nr:MULTISPECIES: PorP/SprF family type IX secretion system membrane protein [Flavobacterium]WGK94384.1 PorP/SprF family type IX secretion system membrane protein [Flavobacterium keumense]
MKKTILILALILSMSEVNFAQEQNIFTRYKYHLNIINPAYVGVDEQSVLTSSLRRQWTGVPDAPELQNISFSTPLNNNLAIGAAIEHNKTYIENYGFAAIDVSYKLYLSRYKTLYFGIKAGADYYNVNLMGIKTHDLNVDPALQSINSIIPNIGVGFLLKEDMWYASIAIPRILNTTRLKDKEGIVFIIDEMPKMYLGFGHDFFITDDIIIKPSLNWDYIPKSSSVLDFTTMVNYSGLFEFGANYGTDNRYALLTTFTVNDRFVFGYAYEMSTLPTLARAKNTNEILLQYKF